MDRFEALQTFVRVVEGGSFSKVAREVGVGQPAVSKQVAALEQRLGVQLLHRTSRSLSLTPAGRDFYESAVRILSEIEDAEDRIGRHQLSPSGLVRVGVPSAFGRMHVVPRLPEFLGRYPDVAIELRVSERPIELANDGMDVLVRTGDVADPTLRSRRVGTTRVATVASAAYVARHGEPVTTDGLADHQLVARSRDGDTLQWRFGGTAGPVAVDPVGAFRSDDAEQLRAAVVSGLGIAQGPEWLYADLLASGEVVPVLAAFAPEPLPIHAVTAAGRRMPSRTGLFIDFMAEAFARDASLAIGDPPG